MCFPNITQIPGFVKPEKREKNDEAGDFRGIFLKFPPERSFRKRPYASMGGIPGPSLLSLLRCLERKTIVMTKLATPSQIIVM